MSFGQGSPSGVYWMTVSETFSLVRIRDITLRILTATMGVMVDFLVFSGSLAAGIPLLLSQWMGAGAGAVHGALRGRHDRGGRRTGGSASQTSIAISFFTVFASGPLLAVTGYLLGNVWAGKVIVLAFTAALTYFLRKLPSLIKAQPK